MQMATNARETSDAKQCGSGHLFRDGKPDQLPRREARGRGATAAARPIPFEQEERSAIGGNRQDRFLPSPFDTRSSSLHVLPSSLDTPAARGRVTRHQRREDLPCPSARHSTLDTRHSEGQPRRARRRASSADFADCRRFTHPTIQSSKHPHSRPTQSEQRNPNQGLGASMQNVSLALSSLLPLPFDRLRAP